MPIYEYQAVEGGCAICKAPFELRRPVDRPELTACPICRRPVKKIISSINTPKILKPMSVSDAKKAGFTVYEKRDTGVYERQ